MVDTAAERFERILYLLPAASGEEGADISELSNSLGVSPGRVLGDLAEVTGRSFYHPAGGADDLQIAVERNRVKVWSSNKFTRPTKLTSREALALTLGLRVLALESGSERRAELLALAERLSGGLATVSPEALEPRYGVEDPESGATGLRGLIRRASEEGRRCLIRYLAPGHPESGERLFSPYVLAYGSGHWYTIGHCGRADAVRVFRLDRIVQARLTEEHFQIPADFDAGEYLEEGRVFRSDTEVEVHVRYSRRVADWVRERGPVEEESDGAVVVGYRVADPDWAVRHVLRYGREAELLGPPELREMVAGVLERVSKPG